MQERKKLLRKTELKDETRFDSKQRRRNSRLKETVQYQHMGTKTKLETYQRQFIQGHSRRRACNTR